MVNTFNMTPADYEQYKANFSAFMATENLANLSREIDCQESYVSRVACAVCKDSQQGMRLDANGFNKCLREAVDYVICEDCEYFAEYGRLPDTVMESIESMVTA